MLAAATRLDSRKVAFASSRTSPFRETWRLGFAMERYKISKKIGEGTGGIVFLAAIVEPSPAAESYGLKAGAFRPLAAARLSTFSLVNEGFHLLAGAPWLQEIASR